MWTVKLQTDPLQSAILQQPQQQQQNREQASFLVESQVGIGSILSDDEHVQLIQEEGLAAGVALCDYLSRRISSFHSTSKSFKLEDGSIVSLEALDNALAQRRGRNRKKQSSSKDIPYVLERTDCFYSNGGQIHLSLRVRIMGPAAAHDRKAELSPLPSSASPSSDSKSEQLKACIQTILKSMIACDDVSFATQIMEHISCVLLQERLRSHLTSISAVAFIADGSILPRKSGATEAPMNSPPAIPFHAPVDSRMTTSLELKVGKLGKYLPSALVSCNLSTSTVSIRGLAILRGITLIVGGGYHGKSTMLQTIAAGVYNKIPGDGREYCVSVSDALSIRAEDGRYVNNCNISAFISNLPSPPGLAKAPDTEHFSSRDCSGSTSQAANVSEAIEMGTSALLVDEDVSAANFMARDGRMRALVMDESITPLLYRVNGLYDTHGISTVVVVGGVGDWLDVPHNVVLMDKYVASDATAKAQSVSRQFSHGHVQYAGRGVVHRLEWGRKGTPAPRRPIASFLAQFQSRVEVVLSDNGQGLLLHNESDSMDVNDNENDDEDNQGVDASRIEQLLNKKQLFGCGICVAWILQQAPKYPDLGIKDLLHRLDEIMDKDGMNQLIRDIDHENDSTWTISRSLLDSVGFSLRPRSFEIGQALNRIRGIRMETLPMEVDEAILEAEREEEERKKRLAEMWANRRKKSFD